MRALRRSLWRRRSARAASGRGTPLAPGAVMTRPTHLLSTLTLAALCAGAAIAACGGWSSPGEMPRLAPQPETVRPNSMPVGAVSAAQPQPFPVFRGAADVQPLADQPTAAALAAGTSDSAAAPLPPLRDGSIPADSRMEPILQRDSGR
jgi:hypothetical protein